MQYAINIYGEDGVFDRLPQATQDRVMQGHKALQDALRARGSFASAKLMPPTSGVILGSTAEFGQKPLVVDGPFSETKEQFLGFYAAEFRDLDEALDFATHLASPYARIEVRPIAWVGGVLNPDA